MAFVKNNKIVVGFAGSRWLGIECFKLLAKRDDVEIKAVCFPKKTEKVWWKDVVDEDEIKRLGFKTVPWGKWNNIMFDITFSVLHGGIFGAQHLENCSLGAINLHPAPLPEYRGCNSYAHAIMNGDKEYRVTMHYIETGIDTGPIIAQGTLPISIEDTGYSLYLRAQKVALGVFTKNLPIIIEKAKQGKTVKARIQNEKIARYYTRNSLRDKKANIKWSPKKFYNFVRALDFPPFEPAYISVGDKQIFLVTQGRLNKLQ